MDLPVCTVRLLLPFMMRGSHVREKIVCSWTTHSLVLVSKKNKFLPSSATSTRPNRPMCSTDLLASRSRVWPSPWLARNRWPLPRMRPTMRPMAGVPSR